LTLISSAFVNYDYGYSVKSGVHIYLYSRALANLGTEKHQVYLQRASKLQDIGGFALTELTHGSNVKGIQTQAHYDHASRSFTLHTPSKDAMKFWIGAVANLANNAVVWSNLYLDGKNLGLHAFVVPLRDKNTHKVLPGVVIGDCGPKTGLNAIDNGFIMFDNYKIPKECLLDKISGIDDNGKFFSVVEGDEKRFGLHLAALSGGRFMISMNSAVLATTALCIGIRYTYLRKQFSKYPSKKAEDLLINYPLTKRRMMPLLAQTIVYNTGNFQILRKWDENYANILNPKNAVIQ
jgi:acyl-CoA oxidase